MCKIVEDLQKESAIYATIKSCRKHKVSDREILKEAMISSPKQMR